MRRLSLFTALTVLLALANGATTSAADGVAALPAFAEPSVSPDHGEIAFVSGGDVWSVPSSGGTARLLAVAGGHARRPLFSPDGKRIAYVSTEPGASGIYVLTLDGGSLRRLTYDDQVPELSAWSADGRYVYFASPSHNIAYDQDVLRVPAGGGTPMQVVHERYVNAQFGAPSPDGTEVAYARNGFTQWWRRGRSHIDESQIVIAHPGTSRFDAVTTGGAKDRWPMWSPDGRTLYFVSDRENGDQLWARDASGRLRRLTSLAPGLMLWPSISRDGRTIAFERAMRIWTYDVESGATRELAITPRGLPDVLTSRHLTLTARFSALDLAPDGKKIAFVARGRVFAAGAQEGGAAQLATTRGGAAYDLPVWAPGSRRVAYVVDRGTESALATYDFPDGPERALTPPGHHDDYPHWSPDGKSLAYVRDGRELHVLDVASHADRVIARGVLDRRPFGDLRDIAFSPAGDWIAYIDQDREGFQNVSVVPVSGGTPRAITFLPNGNAGSLAWTRDGTRIFFVTSQRTENGQIAQVDLVPRPPHFREQQFRELFQELPTRTELPSRTIATPAPSSSPRPAVAASPTPSPAHAPERTEIRFAGIRDRLTFVASGLDVTSLTVTPDAKTLVFAANAAGQDNVYALSIDETSSEPPVPKQLTSTPGRKTNLAVTPDGKLVVFLDAGRPFVADVTGKGARPIAATAETDVDFADDRRLVFDQAWSLLDRWYADPNFHGANWEAVRREYEPFVLGSHSPDELYRVLSLMIGELNSSHTGVGQPPTLGVPRFITGRIGVDWSAEAYDRDGTLRVATVVPLGPADVAGIVPGDVLQSVDGVPVERSTDVDARFANRIGKRTELRTRRGEIVNRPVVVLPVDRSADERLRYLAWVASRRAYVEKISGGRIGYVHIEDMGTASLDKFFTDLDVQNRAKAAVIVDVRNNTGGFVDPYVIDVLVRREYLRFKSRFWPDSPERTSLGQRALDLPTALVTNEHSLSDAENLTEAYRVLRAGPVIGEPTAGWIIFTSAAGLADGGVVRLPSTRVFAHDGVDMELHPRAVDVRVANPPGFDERGEDPQLAAAVRELLRRAGPRR